MTAPEPIEVLAHFIDRYPLDPFDDWGLDSPPAEPGARSLQIVVRRGVQRWQNGELKFRVWAEVGLLLPKSTCGALIEDIQHLLNREEAS